MKHEHTCVICGKIFYSNRYHAYTCSESCRRKRQAITSRQKREEKKKEPRPVKEKDRLAAINEEARKRGLTYGKYKALSYINKQI